MRDKNDGSHKLIALLNTKSPRDVFHATLYYVNNFRLYGSGTPDERVSFFVVNGGWTASLYKDGRFYCEGSKFNYLVAFLGYENAASGLDYNDAIHDFSVRLKKQQSK